MTVPQEETWLDGDAGRLVRPYTVTNGRTKPATALDLMSMIMATGQVPRAHLEPDHVQILGLCRHPCTVAEIAGRMRLPAAVTKVLLSDLLDCGAVVTRYPQSADETNDHYLLGKVLDALQRRL